MTELERHLNSALTKLSAQYEMDMQQLSEQNIRLSQQVQTLTLQTNFLAKDVMDLKRLLTTVNKQLELFSK